MHPAIDSLCRIRATAAICGLLAALAASNAGAVVYTKSAASVDSLGGANYSIPIAIPPGTAGMAPSLSLSYNSMGPNGQAGVGWALGGFSAITRCPSTQATNGVTWGVHLDASDRFCLDGRPLVAVGSGTYGADGTEYRTEIETYAKVTSYGVAGTGPAYFRVYTQNGLIMEYGSSTASRIEAPGQATVRVWAVNYVADRSGNYYVFGYVKNATTGEFTPDRIDYTANAAASMSSYNSVQFFFETRPDVDTYYVGTVAIKQEKWNSPAIPDTSDRCQYGTGVEFPRYSGHFG